MTSDEDLFRQALGDDVKPLKKAERALIQKTDSIDSNNKDYARRAAENAIEQAGAGDFESISDNYVSDEYVEMLKPTDLLIFKHSGMQNGVFKKFRLGKYPLQGSLDLHRRTVREARQDVFQFIEEAIRHDARILIILHGKGERNIERPAVLKSYVAKWLKEIPDVIAYHSAQQKHGGVGAVYVMLRKSEKAKNLTREQHGQRGIDEL